jgi:catalase
LCIRYIFAEIFHQWAFLSLMVQTGGAIKQIKKAATDAGAAVKIIAPKVGGAKLADGSMLPADGQLAGTPSVLFDAVAIILFDEGAKTLAVESAAIDSVRDAFGHLKAIAFEESECWTRRRRRSC